MSYSINKSNGDLLVTLEDGTADLNSTSLALIGRNFAGYGEYFNENFVKLLENFSRSTQPANPLTGQLWYDSTNKILKVYDGSAFVSSGGGVQLDKTSNTVHYTTFVETDTGLPPTKVAKEKGLSFQPQSGNFGINKTAAATSKLEINNGVSATRTLNATLPNTALHVHSEDQVGVRVLLDGYGSGLTATPTMTFRRGPLFGLTGTTAATQLGTVLADVTARGHSGSAFSTDRAIIRMISSQTWTGAANGVKIEFHTTQNGTTVTEAKAIIHDNGDFEVKGDIIGFSLSDERLKTNIVKIENALDKIEELQGVLYNWNEQAEEHGKTVEQRETGLLAGGVHRVLPEATQRRQNGLLAVRYERLMGLIVEGIKELRAEVNVLKNTRAV